MNSSKLSEEKLPIYLKSQDILFKSMRYFFKKNY